MRFNIISDIYKITVVFVWTVILKFGIIYEKIFINLKLFNSYSQNKFHKNTLMFCFPVVKPGDNLTKQTSSNKFFFSFSSAYFLTKLWTRKPSVYGLKQYNRLSSTQLRPLYHVDESLDGQLDSCSNHVKL